MSIHRISREEFDSLDIDKMGFFPEKSWFKSNGIDIAGTVIRDPFDKDWSYVIVAKEEDGLYRYINGEVSLEKMYDLSPRKFEELVAAILKDMGFDVELTKATRDGGRDIIAHIRNSVCSYLTHIECKKYAPENKIGVGIIREVMGVHHLRQATKSIIVTTGFFSKDAIKEAEVVENHLALRDFNNLKEWLQRY